MTIHLNSHNDPHEDSLVRMASVSDLFFNYQHDHLALARKVDPGLSGMSMEAFIASERDGLRLDAVEFSDSVRAAFGWNIDPDELVEDYFGRE